MTNSTLYEESTESDKDGAKPSRTDIVAAISFEDIEFTCENAWSSMIMSSKEFGEKQWTKYKLRMNLKMWGNKKSYIDKMKFHHIH